MGGKASIYMILGFSLIFLVAGYNFSSLTNRAVTNEANYFSENRAHDLAVSGANLGSNALFLDKTWHDSYNLNFNGGTIQVTVAHLSEDRARITSIGSYTSSVQDTIIIMFRPSNFAKFGYYMNIFPSSLCFATGDTLSGPFHTQQTLYTQGRPVFNGKASAKNGWVNNDPSKPQKKPIFLGGIETGIDIPMPTDVNSVKTQAAAGGKVLRNSTGKEIDVRLVFNSNGTVTYSSKLTSSSVWSTDSIKTLSTWAPNGIIYVQKGNLYVKGTVNGQYTIVADQDGGTNSGKVYLEDDIKYSDPVVYNSTDKNWYVNGDDMLGIVSTKNIEIVDNAANRNNIIINAALFSLKGGLHIANESMPVSGYIRLLGGLTEYQSQITGKLSGSTLVNGYNERIYFDQRFSNSAPPYYPTTGKLEVVSWYETTWFPKY